MASTSITLQLRYHFQDQNKHTLDAFVRNENEKDFLLMLREVVTLLDLDVKIESEALREGSLTNLLKFIGDNEKQIKLLGSLAVALFITVPLTIQQYRNMDIDYDIKSIEYELKKEELKKVKKEAISADSIQMNEIVGRVVDELQHDLKIQVHKSHFYQRVTQQQEIQRISTLQLSEDKKPISEEKHVEKADFPKFVLKSNKLPPIVDDEAIIEIVSPVLKASDYGWKGIYHNETVSFKMLDEAFKGSVLSKQYTFANGDSIKCVLQIIRELDEVGAIRIVERNVLVVLEKISKNEPSVVTPEGKKYLRNKKAIANQLSIFPKK